MISTDSRVIEIGCGQGELPALLNAREKVGIDWRDLEVVKVRETSSISE